MKPIEVVFSPMPLVSHRYRCFVLNETEAETAFCMIRSGIVEIDILCLRSDGAHTMAQSLAAAIAFFREHTDGS